MDLMPILQTLRRHKTAVFLIVFEIALTTAIVCNALHLISLRIGNLQRDNGVVEQELLVLGVRATNPNTDADGLTAQDLVQLRALPGVRGATVVNQVIYGSNSNNTGVSLNSDKTGLRVVASNFDGGEGALATLGWRLVAGRDFLAEEFQSATLMMKQDKPQLPQVIISRELAQTLFQGGNALGRAIYIGGDSPSIVVGVAEGMVHPYPGRSTNSSDRHAMLFPVRNSFRGGSYLLRVDPAQRDAVLKAAAGVIDKVDNTRIVFESKRLSDMRDTYYAQDRAMAWLMGGVCVALLLVTAFGIVGLASFWVQQRTRMIGTRRALGATMGQILRYFQLENLILTSVGIVLGMVGAYGLSLLLMAQYELPQLPASYLPLGALALWALGQLAVLAPARRAAALPPVAALRA